MKLYINLPTTDEGIDILNKSMATIQTTLLLKTIDDLILSNDSKNKVLLNVIDEIKKEIGN